jgi:hypothetical protein
MNFVTTYGAHKGQPFRERGRRLVILRRAGVVGLGCVLGLAVIFEGNANSQ